MTPLEQFLVRAEALLQRVEAVLPQVPREPDWKLGFAFRWRKRAGGNGYLQAVAHVSPIALDDLQNIAAQKLAIEQNTRQFVSKRPANNVLLTGARGTGKSSLVKAVHAEINQARANALALVEIHREDIPTLPHLLKILRDSPRRVLLFCDDLSFDAADESYKSLKAVLDGGVEGRPANVLFYATSNRRHLMAREMIDNERSTAIHASEAVEEKVSLSDRFGLWLGFHNLDQATYFAIIDGYAKAFELDIAEDELHAQAVEWSMTRGSRSGRVAWQFIQDLAGKLGRKVE